MEYFPKYRLCLAVLGERKLAGIKRTLSRVDSQTAGCEGRRGNVMLWIRTIS